MVTTVHIPPKRGTPPSTAGRVRALRRAAGSWKGSSKKSIRILARIRRGWNRPAV